MLQIIQSTSTPVSKETGLLNSNWKRVLFFFHRRVFLSKIEGILSAVAGHESNSLAPGNYQYQILSARADSLCGEFADRWDLDLDLLRARIPGLAKLAILSIPPPTKNHARLAWLVIATPLALFLLGVLASLISVGFHFVGGR
jgi:hypothetical protein